MIVKWTSISIISDTCVYIYLLFTIIVDKQNHHSQQGSDKCGIKEASCLTNYQTYLSSLKYDIFDNKLLNRKEKNPNNL